MVEEKIELTPEEAKTLAQQFYGAVPMPEEQKGVHQFLHNIATAKDTTKVGNISEEELGQAKLPVRTLKELGLFCKDVAGKKNIGSYFDSMSEILTSTSLSKEGFLARLAVLVRREAGISLPPPKKKKNKGWFGKKKGGVSEY